MARGCNSSRGHVDALRERASAGAADVQRDSQAVHLRAALGLALKRSYCSWRFLPAHALFCGFVFKCFQTKSFDIIKTFLHIGYVVPQSHLVAISDYHPEKFDVPNLCDSVLVVVSFSFIPLSSRKSTRTSMAGAIHAVRGLKASADPTKTRRRPPKTATYNEMD